MVMKTWSMHQLMSVVQAPEGQTTERLLLPGLQAWLDQGCHCLLSLCLYPLLSGVESAHPVVSAVSPGSSCPVHF